MRRSRLAALAATLLTTAALASASAAPSHAAESEWQDGYSDSDTIINCSTSTPGVGFSAQTGWRSPTGQVPKVGEKFYLRGYIGLVSLPCSDVGLTIPEVLAPAGVEFVEEPFIWGIYNAGSPGTLTSGGVDFFNGVNGGVAITRAGDEPFRLKRGQILEFQFPVRATRELKGTATQAPTCLSRREGDAPCPRAQSGDHLQIAFNVGGHGGDKYYVTPYVPLFAAAAGSGGGDTTPPRTSISGGPANGSIVTSSSAVFTLGSTESGSRMTCTLDSRARTCATGRHAISGLAPGTHLFRAKATDPAGNVDPTGASRYWTVPVPAKSLTRSSGWSLVSASSAYGGRVLATTRKNASVSYKVRSARKLALVASGGTTHGTVRVYAGSRLLKTVSLRTSRSVTKRVIAITTFSSAYSGTVKVVVTTSGRAVRLEGIAAPTR
ncbi:hypothetical protein ASE01_09540 [Nocardioides sp. Root190]|uniref:hypothetical protein n=1 Tax=Nocardioides sp. Root190 TaxID=1736488 RepID=UPI0006F38507|nr:hypothetical protein [Nocardioides sp. Root190]KRB76997.1 hypothetical protein ASE01_09540 [Nocardioides sp. Root190]